MSLSDLFHQASYPLGLSMLLKIAEFLSFFMAEKYSFVCMYICIYIYSAINWSIDLSVILSFQNMIPVSLSIYISRYHSFLYPFTCWWMLRLLPYLGYCKCCCYEHWDIYPGVELLDHMVVLFLVFRGTSILFSIVATPVYISSNNVLRFSFLHILDSIYYLCFFWW